MGSSFRRLFEGCYRRMYVKIVQKAEAEGWWGDCLLPITAADVAEAIARMKRGKAGAESGVVADIFKRLDAKSVEALAQVFDQWKENGRAHDRLNTALLRLLPKSDKGRADMSDCRPVSLMEHISLSCMNM